MRLRRRKKGLPYLELLQSCADKRDAFHGLQLHADILCRGLLHSDPYIASALIHMYAKCGELGQAQKVLEELPVRDVVSWSSLIAGYARQGRGHEALDCFEAMQGEGLLPNEVTFLCALKACASVGAVDMGKRIHDELVDRGLPIMHSAAALASALVDMYGKCGMLAEAAQVLEQLPVRDVVSWSSLIAGYVRHDEGFEALDCYERMEQEGVVSNEVTFACVSKACGITKDIVKGKQIHCEIVKKSLLEENVVLANALVDMYAKCGALREARNVLEALPVRNVVSWCALIAGYVEEGRSYEALFCYEEMKQEGLSLDLVAFSCVLKACGQIGAVGKGKEIHEEIVDRGLLTENISIGNALVDMYGKCGMLEQAREVLDDLPVRNVVTWSTLIAGYALHERGREALDCFAQMRREGFSPNEFTLSCILKACGDTCTVEKGKNILREDAANEHLETTNIVLGTALMDMYIKCGNLAEAEQAHKKFRSRDVISWSTLIAGLAQQGQGYEAFECYEIMKKEGLYADEVTFTCILAACASIGATYEGKQIHEEILSGGFLDRSIILGNALVNMYTKCGLIEYATEVLETLPIRNAVSWNSFIGACSHNWVEALKCSVHMVTEGVLPDEVTCRCILNACRNSCRMDGPQLNVADIKKTLTTELMLEHHACMVGILGCSDEAMTMIKSMPMAPNEYASCWLTLLGACQKWGNMRVATLAFSEMMMMYRD